MVSENKKGLGGPMLGFLAVSLFLLMLVLSILEYPGWVLGETLMTDVIDSDSSYLLIGGGVGGLLLAFSAVGKFERGRPGKNGEGIFIVLMGIFLVWASIFKTGETIYDLSVIAILLAFFLAMIFSLYDDYESNRRMGFGAVTVMILIVTFSMCFFMEPEVYQIGIMLAGAIWIIVRSVRELFA